MLKCPTCNSKKSRFMKEKEGNGLLSHVGIKTSLSKIPLFSDKFTKINSIINSSYFPGDKFIPKNHSRQPGFAYSSGESFTKNKAVIQNSNKQEVR